jgi:hypothetical protein
MNTKSALVVAFVSTCTLFIAHAFFVNGDYIEPQIAKGNTKWWAVAFVYYMTAHFLANMAIGALAPRVLAMS